MITAPMKKGSASKLLACAALARARQPFCRASQARGSRVVAAALLATACRSPATWPAHAQAIGQQRRDQHAPVGDREARVVIVGRHCSSCHVSAGHQRMRDGAQVHVFEFAARRHAARQPRDRAGRAACSASPITCAVASPSAVKLVARITSCTCAVESRGRTACAGRCPSGRCRRAGSACPSARSTSRGTPACAPAPPGRPASPPRTACCGRAAGRGRCCRPRASVKVLHTLAVPHVVDRLLQRAREQLRAFAVVLQQVEGHARGRLHAHAGQAAQRLDQRVERTGSAMRGLQAQAFGRA